MDDVFRVFMFLLPFSLCIVAYVWVGKKAWKTSNAIAKIIALAFVLGGGGYTIYKLVRSIGSFMTNDNFEFAIFIVTAFVLFFASIAMALGEPEEKTVKTTGEDKS